MLTEDKKKTVFDLCKSLLGEGIPYQLVGWGYLEDQEAISEEEFYEYANQLTPHDLVGEDANPPSDMVWDEVAGVYYDPEEDI